MQLREIHFDIGWHDLTHPHYFPLDAENSVDTLQDAASHFLIQVESMEQSCPLLQGLAGPFDKSFLAGEKGDMLSVEFFRQIFALSTRIS